MILGKINETFWGYFYSNRRDGIMEKLQQYFDKVYEETYNNVLKYVILKTDNLSYVEDIMQNVYIAFYNTIKKKGVNYLIKEEAYLIKLVKSELFKYYTLKNKLKVLLSLKEDKSDILDNIPNEIDIENIVLNKVSAEEIWKFIKMEELLTQKIMALYFQREMKISEIAELLVLSEANVKNRLYRTIDKLKKRFGGVNNE